MTNKPFVIRDCNGKIVGNRNGYRTHKGAFRQANLKGSSAYKQIWKAFYEKTNNDNLICTITEEMNRVYPCRMYP